MEKVLIGLSGGVDSSVAAAVLKQQGFEVLGATLKMHGGLKNSEKDISDAKDVCEKLNIPHNVFDFSSLFKTEVEDYFVNAYLKGETPNPCIVCNKTSACFSRSIISSCKYCAFNFKPSWGCFSTSNNF
jgi:tRNA-specific 2-thiouridylase